ncbi:hypothetical protein M408DRAFT_148885 [Serendipita vermifera MAFF 305830]|uniref:Uncharacterized protein n=1 Tax=Serendipita vermifera MAFF 305830 TaxID=933852 RepID=A0A0C3ALH1_SERVB|nr:hypothetical protein M408DRAFT_148885 [Serendipita vermifera MAFF 305830]
MGVVGEKGKPAVGVRRSISEKARKCGQVMRGGQGSGGSQTCGSSTTTNPARPCKRDAGNRTGEDNGRCDASFGLWKCGADEGFPSLEALGVGLLARKTILGNKNRGFGQKGIVLFWAAHFWRVTRNINI